MLEIWSWKWKTQSFQRLIFSGQVRIPMDKELEAPARMPRMRLILRGEETDLWTRKQRRRRRSPVLALSPVSPLLLSGRHVTSTYVTLEKVHFGRLSVINKPPKLGSSFSAGSQTSDIFCFFWVSPKAIFGSFRISSNAIFGSVIISSDHSEYRSKHAADQGVRLPPPPLHSGRLLALRLDCRPFASTLCRHSLQQCPRKNRGILHKVGKNFEKFVAENISKKFNDV